jgi:hypothetical protein
LIGEALPTPPAAAQCHLISRLPFVALMRSTCLKVWENRRSVGSRGNVDTEEPAR